MIVPSLGIRLLLLWLLLPLKVVAVMVVAIPVSRLQLRWEEYE